MNLKEERISEQFIKQLPFLNPLNEISNYNKPVLSIHGDADITVLPINSYSYLNAFTHQFSRIIILKKANHLFNDRKNKTLIINHTTSWFNDLLK